MMIHNERAVRKQVLTQLIMEYPSTEAHSRIQSKKGKQLRAQLQSKQSKQNEIRLLTESLSRARASKKMLKQEHDQYFNCLQECMAAIRSLRDQQNREKECCIQVSNIDDIQLATTLQELQRERLLKAERQEAKRILQKEAWEVNIEISKLLSQISGIRQQNTEIKESLAEIESIRLSLGGRSEQRQERRILERNRVDAQALRDEIERREQRRRAYERELRSAQQDRVEKQRMESDRMQSLQKELLKGKHLREQISASLLLKQGRKRELRSANLHLDDGTMRLSKLISDLKCVDY